MGDAEKLSAWSRNLFFQNSAAFGWELLTPSQTHPHNININICNLFFEWGRHKFWIGKRGQHEEERIILEKKLGQMKQFEIKKSSRVGNQPKWAGIVCLQKNKNSNK